MGSLLLIAATLALTSCGLTGDGDDELSRTEAEELAAAMMSAAMGSLPDLATPARQREHVIISNRRPVTVDCPSGGSAEVDYSVGLRLPAQPAHPPGSMLLDIVLLAWSPRGCRVGGFVLAGGRIAIGDDLGWFTLSELDRADIRITGMMELAGGVQWRAGGRSGYCSLEIRWLIVGAAADPRTVTGRLGSGTTLCGHAF